MGNLIAIQLELKYGQPVVTVEPIQAQRHVATEICQEPRF